MSERVALHLFQNGTLLQWSSMGNSYTGFVVGICSYDNCGEDNAYVIRYVTRKDDGAVAIPHHPFAITSIERVELVTDWDEDFNVCGHWSATPDDRCELWELTVDKATGNLMITPQKGKP